MIFVSFNCRNIAVDSPTSITPQVIKQPKSAMLIPLPLPGTGSVPGRWRPVWVGAEAAC